jgi:hypothetical protein|tara:strand:- start:64 stop:774 length:711 start_codon:yes stop_codon:yes gene_type:complete
MPLPLIAIPVLHSSGAWIAYAGTGYLGGTLSASWVGALILGNSTLFTSIGLVSTAGIAAASGVLAGFGASATAGLGAALTAVGLGSVASWMGIAPAATFLGLTTVGWTFMGVGSISVALGAVITRRVMKKMNEERAKGGLEAITVRQLISEVREYEASAVREVLRKLASNDPSLEINDEDGQVSISGRVLSFKKLRYRINKDGSEEIGYLSRIGRFVRVYLVKSTDGDSGPGPIAT